MEIYPFVEFQYKTFGGQPNQADWTPYFGKSYECACGTTHTFDESTEVLRELSGMRFVIRCDAGWFVTLITITVFANVKSLFGGEGKFPGTLPEEEVETVAWYRQAEKTEATRTGANAEATRTRANAGDAVAQFNLGVMYHNGEGVPQDAVEAVAWYRQAAEQGHAGGQVNLGVMYRNGRGVPQDNVEAAAWYRQAAEQGHAPAQYNLGLMYVAGQGVPQDDVEAYKWFSLSATYADAEQREHSIKSRDTFAERLHSGQRDEAQERVREWFASHPRE